ncbi:radical SAM protein [Candidatus Poribacteria bacterium]|nr:radical SAM protein [Candidatus Poribacteria bacterium]
MSKNILLINPWIYDFKAYDSWVKPLGLLYIGSVLEQNGYNVSLIDCLDRTDESLDDDFQKNDKFGCGQYHREEISKPEILKIIPRRYKKYGINDEIFKKHLNLIPAPDVILITSYMTYWYPGVFHAIKILKQNYPNTPIILGGIYAALCFEHAKKYSAADYIWEGAFNHETLNLINNLSGNNNLNSHFTLPITGFRPAYHLYKKIHSVAILTSLGCPFKCTYCASKLLQPEFIERPISDIVNEIEFYYDKYNISHIAFYDDALLFNSSRHIELLLDILISKNLNINFYTPNGLHARYITSNLANKMKKAGFNELRISLETANPELQKNTGGKIFNFEFKNSIKFLIDAGFDPSKIGIYIMVGLPDQNYNDILNTIEFVHNEKLKIKLINFSPLPKTTAWTKLPFELQNKLEEEPLLQNDIAYLSIAQNIDWEQNKKLKKMVFELNMIS